MTPQDTKDMRDHILNNNRKWKKIERLRRIQKTCEIIY